MPRTIPGQTIAQKIKDAVRRTKRRKRSSAHIDCEAKMSARDRQAASDHLADEAGSPADQGGEG